MSADEFNYLPADLIERAAYVSIYAAAYVMAVTKCRAEKAHYSEAVERADAKRIADEWLESVRFEGITKLPKKLF